MITVIFFLFHDYKGTMSLIFECKFCVYVCMCVIKTSLEIFLHARSLNRAYYEGNLPGS